MTLSAGPLHFYLPLFAETRNSLLDDLLGAFPIALSCLGVQINLQFRADFVDVKDKVAAMNDATEFSAGLESCEQFLLDLGPKLICVTTATLVPEEAFLRFVERIFAAEKAGLGFGSELEMPFNVSLFFGS